jgi:hypothetical protein
MPDDMPATFVREVLVLFQRRCFSGDAARQRQTVY